MKVFYNPYSLTPKKKANRLSSLGRKSGIFLKGVLGKNTTFSDYFPHEELGDRNCEEFLSEFKFQKVTYEQKVFDLLLKDQIFQNLNPKKFYNHQLWSGTESIESKLIKYKLRDLEDRSFMLCLEKGLRLRLDANALFKRSDYLAFVKGIPERYHAQIEYMEDPLKETDWSKLYFSSASDFISGTPHSYYVYKPNCEFKPSTEAKIIFSSYLGSDFGRWHAYCELVKEGDLSLTHGIVTPGSYEGEKSFFSGSYQNGFEIEQTAVRRLYQDLSDVGWKLLCSM